MAANRRRGEVSAVIDGETRVLCLTLGALAELEDAFDADDMGALAKRFGSAQLSAGDILRIVAAGLRGAGGTETNESVATMRFDGGVAGAAVLVPELLGAAFGAEPAANP